MERKPKIITICGSFKFREKILELAMQMELAGNVILTPIFPIKDDKVTCTQEEARILGKMHKEKIKLSDAILVVNVNGYIGNATKSEIEYAKTQNKEILYLEPIN